jgi:hypothetical protein
METGTGMSASDSLNGTKPTWFRANVGIAHHPKLLQLRYAKQHEAAWLWLDSIGYASEHLTDGWVPPWFPTSRGFRARDAEALVAVELWHPMQIGDCGGWLIHDYLAYQKSKAEWEEEARAKREKARKAAASRWGDK